MMLTTIRRLPFSTNNPNLKIIQAYPFPLDGLIVDYDMDKGVALGADGISAAAVTPYAGSVVTPLTTSATTQPNLDLTGLNGYRTVTFDGAGDYLRALFPCAQPYTEYLVWRLNAWVANKVVMEGGAASTGRLILASASPSVRMTSGTTDSSLGAAPLGVFGISTMVWDNLNSTYQLNNGAAVGFEGAGVAPPNGLILGSGVNASGVPSSALATSITIARILRYAGNHPAATRTAIYTALAARYAL